MTAFESRATTDDHVRVALLGGFGLILGSNALRVPRASQRLLAFLALQGRMVKRAAVAGVLWPDASESHAYSNLRSALARLRGTTRKVLAIGKLELGLAEGVTVDIRHAQVLAHRLLDPAAMPDPSELGPGPLDLDLAWRAYVRRFDLEHTVRFAKQTLGWTTPRPRHPEQADRWTWLVLAGYTQLRLAREVVADKRLPWERPRPPGG
jgi:hypothetical protein